MAQCRRGVRTLKSGHAPLSTSAHWKNRNASTGLDSGPDLDTGIWAYRVFASVNAPPGTARAGRTALGVMNQAFSPRPATVSCSIGADGNPIAILDVGFCRLGARAFHDVDASAFS